MNYIQKASYKIRGFLSHYPNIYATIVGIGIVLFWRGVWHTTDHVHLFIDSLQNLSSTSISSGLWWDGPLSFVVGVLVLYFTGAFSSSFIGNELILSGLRGEKRLTERAETDIKHEVIAIADIKEEINTVSSKLEQLQKEFSERG
jgi:uncharacterized membrane protein